ncbi:farnesol dehydrogenase-like [Phymastichus coffea]|uniref:farnesol dehydrogenase-like n=1 Tax=Phymastichus coffea TaxID=108790 RepID=UPI00273C3196|nr:farnesol dehydrogenase-like [Phymastichus coffea]
MERWDGKVAVVTGASSGIGLETAKALVRNGMIVVGLARRLETMQDTMKDVTGPGRFYAKKCDISIESQVIDVFKWIEKHLKTVHILVNNAGLGYQSSLLDLKTDDMLQIINVNIVGLLHCTRQSMKLMIDNQHEAHIVNINSIFGHRVSKLSKTNIYPATKHAVTALSQTLIAEIKGDKIRVTSISPGIVATEFFEKYGLDPNILNTFPSIKPQDVADSIIHVISAPQHVEITELTIKPLGQLW